MYVEVEVLKRENGYVAKIGKNMYSKPYETPYDLLMDLNPDTAKVFMDKCVLALQKIVEENKK